MNKSFFWGAVVGVGSMWAWHKYVRPMSSNATK